MPDARQVEASPGAVAPLSRPLRADIDLSAIEDNARSIKRLVGPACELMAVVKANGYGLGARWVAEAALAGGATRLAVARVDEGVELRRAGFECPILVMAFAAPEESGAIVEHRLSAVVVREEMARALEVSATARLSPPGSVAVHIKVDTGLGRYGCAPEEVASLATALMRWPHLRLEGLMTHFAESDADDPSFTLSQLERFEALRRDLDRQGFRFEMVHAANSAATLGLPPARLNLVRCGIALTGHYPSPRLREVVSLRPALTLAAQVARVFEVREGESVGYGRTWIAERPSTIGLIPVGYADGYVRALSNRAEVLVRGRRCPLAGRVSMDQAAVDLTGVPGVRQGDEVVLIGRQENEEISVDEVARHAGTISYEILCGLTPRVAKRYLRDGQTVAECDLLGCETQ